jgi:hypothetical protein
MPATFHDPYNGHSFEKDIRIGQYSVTNEGHTLSYETIPGEAKSSCICPVCLKKFEVNLAPEKNDLDAAWTHQAVFILAGLI